MPFASVAASRELAPVVGHHADLRRADDLERRHALGDLVDLAHVARAIGLELVVGRGELKANDSLFR